MLVGSYLMARIVCSVSGGLIVHLEALANPSPTNFRMEGLQQAFT